MTPEQKKILEELRLEKRIQEDRQRLEGTRFPVDLQPASYMDRINYLTRSIQSMGSPVIRGIESAEETIGAPLYMLGRTGSEPTQEEWEASVRRGEQFSTGIPPKEGPDLTQLPGELTTAIALTKGQGVQPTAIGRVFQAIANSQMLAPMFAEGDPAEAMTEAMKWASILGPGFEAVPPIWKYTGKPAADWFSRITATPRERVGQIVRRTLGDSADEVAEAMRTTKSRVPGEPLTAGQAAVPAGSREMSAIQKMAEAKDPTKYGKIAEAQMAARQAHLARHGGRVDMLKSDRDIVTKPMREEALKRADVGTKETRRLGGKLAKEREAQVSAMRDEGRFRTTAAEQQTLAEGGRLPTRTKAGQIVGEGQPSPSAYPVPGQPRVPARYTENIQRVGEADEAAQATAGLAAARRAQANLTQYQLDSLAAHSEYPLTSQFVVQVIDDRLADTALPTVTRKALETIKKDVLSRTDADGVIRSDALYTVRKEIGLRLQGIFKDIGAKWDKAQAGKAQRDVQNIIDDAIENAGGSGWRDYLTEFAERSKDVESVTAANKVIDALTTPSGLKQRSAEQFARQTGKTEIRSAQTQAAVDAVQDSLNRDMQMAAMAQQGMPKASAEMGLEVIPKMPTVGPMSIKITIVRGMLSRLREKMDEGALQYMAKYADDPEVMAELIRQAGQPGPLHEVSREVLKRMGAVAVAGAASQDIKAPGSGEKIPFVGDYF